MSHVSELMQDYNKLPKQPNVDQVFLLDPLIATGGTVCAALNMIKDWGYPSKCKNESMDQHHDPQLHNLANRVKLLSVLASRVGLDTVQEEFPEVEVRSNSVPRREEIQRHWQIWVAAVDEVLTPQGIISPGLGDAVRLPFLELKRTEYLIIHIGRPPIQHGLVSLMRPW